MTRATILAFALIATAASAQAPTPAAAIAGGSLYGVVRDVTGATLTNVNVTLLGETAATRTDSGGHFALRGRSARHVA